MKHVLTLLAVISMAFHAQAQNITTIAGNGVMGYNGDDILATSAELNFPNVVVPDNHGNLYIAEEGSHRVRKVNASGRITTIAGTGVAGYSGDGAMATDAKLNVPTGIAIDTSGNIFVSELGNNCIRKINTSGIISTIAGTGVSGFGGDGGPATAAKLWLPRCMAFDKWGNLYVPDTHNDRIRKINTSGIITTVAGNGIHGYTGDNGLATTAELNGPQGVTIDDTGNIYIAEGGNSVIRKVNKTTGIITTIAGTGVDGFSGDEGPATNATMYGCFDVALDHAGNIFFTDNQNHRVRKVSPDGIIHTVAGDGTPGFNGDNIAATSAHLHYPKGISIDKSDNVFVADQYNNRIPYFSAIPASVKQLPTHNISCSISPNPNDGVFTITADLPGANHYCDIEIKTFTGKTVYHQTQQFPAEIMTKQLQLDLLPPGIYTVTISNNEVYKTATFIRR